MRRKRGANDYNLIVIGGGASGLACVVNVIQHYHAKGKNAPSILIIEKNKKPGKKLLMTGNGRCNVTHHSVSKGAYHGTDVTFCHYALEKYDDKYTESFFDSLGLAIFFDDQGRAYPRTLHSGSVLDTLRFTIEDAGIQIVTSTTVAQIEKNNDRYHILTDQDVEYYSDTVVLATGGACAPQTGSDGQSYALATSLGHKRTQIYPGIVQMKTDTSFVKKLAGLRFNVRADIYVDCKITASDKGEILFTDYGVSGPVALQLSGVVSRYTQTQKKKNSDIRLKIDFLPELSQDVLKDILFKRAEQFSQRTVERFLAGFMVNRLSLAIIRYASDISMTEKMCNIHSGWIDQLTQAIKCVDIKVLGVRGLSEAQVTIGGLMTKDFYAKTMESRLHAGLFAIGEVLDIDGDCGGYNLQWAWSSARLAADAIVSLLESRMEPTNE